MTTHHAYFFEATQSVSDDLGKMFNFSWATYLGLRELWWQVKGYSATYPDLSAKQLESKFIGGFALPGGIDFKKTMLQTTWEEHEQSFAKSVLFEACTLYEGWLEAICELVFSDEKVGKKVAEQLQFRAGNLKGKPGIPWDFKVATDQINSSTSLLMANEFFPRLRSNGLNCWSHFDEYLIAYRYFKECRNSFIHSNGRVNDRVVAQHALLSQIQACHRIPMKHPFNHEFILNAQHLGNKIQLSLHDCKLFATIVHRMIVTLDATFSVNSACEIIAKKSIEQYVNSNKSKWKNLSPTPSKRLRKVKGILAGSKLPLPINITAVDDWLTTQKII
jgi:hypothetical protein